MRTALSLLALVGVAAAAPATSLVTLMGDDFKTKGGKNLTAMTLWSWSRVFGAPIDKVVLETRVRWVAGRVSAGSNNWLPSNSAMIPSGWGGTIFGSNPGFVDISTYDLRLASASPLINNGDPAPASPAGHPFINPLFPPAFVPPLHTLLAVGTASARPVNGTIDIGAYEF
jgi:hypothetical protein